MLGDVLAKHVVELRVERNATRTGCSASGPGRGRRWGTALLWSLDGAPFGFAHPVSRVVFVIGLCVFSSALFVQAKITSRGCQPAIIISRILHCQPTCQGPSEAHSGASASDGVLSIVLYTRTSTTHSSPPTQTRMSTHILFTPSDSRLRRGLLAPASLDRRGSEEPPASLD